MKIIKRFILGPLRTNCYLINANDHICLIDAGVNPQKIIDYCVENNLIIEYILLTHTHYDHIGGLNDIKAIFPNAQVIVGSKEQSFLRDPESNLSILDDEYYQYHGQYQVYEQYNYEHLGFSIFHISGHSLDSICLYFKKDHSVFSGDTLFRHSIGRSDLIYGNEFLLEEGIRNHLYTLPGNTKVYPGHGFSTTIKEEKMNNLILRG